jgi:hypothetical protein
MKPATAKDMVDPTIRGAKHAAGYKASVFAVLGGSRRVLSRGSRFLHKDRWTVRICTTMACEWAAKNPGCVPTRADVAAWVRKANQQRIYHPEILIAKTPDRLPLRTALALTGGAYHEGFHGTYSCRRDITVDEMAAIILPRWAKVADWSKYHKMLQEWSNLVEDIRIERRGQEDFPGVRTKLCDLQDFILHQEAEGEAKARAAGQTPSALSVVSRTFRDIGLGYPTHDQRLALAKYKRDNPEAVGLVLDGPLSDLLREAIALAKDDDTGCLRIAMDAIAKLAELGQAPEEDEQDGEGQGQETRCPSCNAPGDKLVIRPKADGYGGKVPGKGIITCTSCGWQDEIDLEEQSGGQPGEPQSGPSPTFEDFDEDDQGDDQQDGQGQSGDDQGDQDGQGGGSSQDTQNDVPDDHPGSTLGDECDDADDGDDQQDGAGAGEDESDADGEDNGDEDNGDESDQDGKGDKGDQDEDDGETKDEAETGDNDETDSNSPQGGGHHHDESEHDGSDFTDIADQVLDDAANGEDTGLTDTSQALEDAVNDANDKEQGDEEDGEARWNPYDPSLDTIAPVKPSRKGKAWDDKQAQALMASVKQEASFLRARLRSIVRALEQVSVVHGLKRGRDLSEQFLVDSQVAIMGDQVPDRAYYDRDEALDTSLAAAVVIDESGSMGGLLRDATRILCAITEPLDSLGCAVQVSGFRDGQGGRYQDRNGEPRCYHRYGGIVHDVFKTFGEKFKSVRYRFANTRATGGTPMADGVQFGLDALNERKEGHRVLFIVTDGCPNGGHTPIIHRQIRLAKEAGIHVIGVGIGYEARYVEGLFPDSVYSRTVSELPKALIAKLNELLDVRATKRGRRMRKTG